MKVYDVADLEQNSAEQAGPSPVYMAGRAFAHVVGGCSDGLLARRVVGEETPIGPSCATTEAGCGLL